MRIVFIGTVDFSFHCLKTMLDIKANVIGVFTQRREDARFNADWSDLTLLAKSQTVPVFYFKKISDSNTLDEIRKLNPDIIFVLGLSQLLSSEFIGIPALGVIGSHPALLPENRGRHPLIWSLVKGADRGGITLFYIDEGMDTGDIVMQREFQIDITHTANDLYKKIKQLASEMLSELIPLLEKGEAPRIPQDNSKATYLRKRYKNDGLIRWRGGAMKAYNLIRALTLPYVGAHTVLRGEEIKVWAAYPPESQAVAATLDYLPGEIMSVKDGEVTVWANDGPLCITDIEADLSKLSPGEVFS